MATYPVSVHVSAKDTASGVIQRTSRRIGQSLAGIRRNATSASSALGSLGSGISSAVSGAAVFGIGAIGAGMVGAGLAAKSWAEETLDASGELVDFSAKTGFGIEALQEWRYAASQAGVQVGTFNSGLTTFSKNLGLARSNTGKLAKFTKDNLSPALLEQLKGTTSVEEALALYVSAIEAIPDPSKRAAAAQVAFGGAGKDMALLMAAGTQELQRLREEKRRDGVMSSEVATKNEALGDQVERLKGQYEQLKYTVGAATLEAVQPHITGLGQWFEANREVIGQNVGAGVASLAEAFKSISWSDIAAGATKVYEAIGAVGAFAAEAYGNVKKLADLGDELGDRAFDSYQDLKSGIAGLVGVNATDTGADGTATGLGAGTQVVTLEQQRRAFSDASGLLSTFGQGDLAAQVVREAEAIQQAQQTIAERNRASRSGMFNAPTTVFDRVRAAQAAPRTAAERLDSLPFGLGATAAPAAPAPPQEIKIMVETAPGTDARVTKPATASNVKTGTRKVGTGAL